MFVDQLVNRLFLTVSSNQLVRNLQFIMKWMNLSLKWFSDLNLDVFMILSLC